MALTREDRKAVYDALDAMATAARKRVAKARKAYDSAPTSYGGSVEREVACVTLNLLQAQSQAAHNAACSYFNEYLAESAA